MAAPLLSKRDLSDPGVAEQARYELLKAVDRGGDAEQAAWARDWGEAVLQRADDAGDGQDWDWFGPSDSLIQAGEQAQSAADALLAMLVITEPDLAVAVQRATALQKLITTINTKLGEAEE
jgi:hypothetical protein